MVPHLAVLENAKIGLRVPGCGCAGAGVWGCVGAGVRGCGAAWVRGWVSA